MSKLKLLAGVLVLIMAGITAWWFIAASAEKAAITSWLENRRAAGWQAEAELIEVLGFPNRLDLKLTKPALADPVSGWAWSAPWFEVANVIYDPAFFIAIWPEEQQIAAPGERATLRSDVMEASLRTEAGSSLALVRASVDIQKPGLKADLAGRPVPSGLPPISAPRRMPGRIMPMSSALMPFVSACPISSAAWWTRRALSPPKWTPPCLKAAPPLIARWTAPPSKGRNRSLIISP